MSSIGSIALSGLQAAAKRVSVSANNVVNVRTGRPVEVEGESPEGVFQPSRVEQIPLETGGVRAAITNVPSTPLLLVDPDSPTGLAAFPDVDLASEIVQQRLAVRDYKAALSLLRVEKEMDDALLDIKS